MRKLITYLLYISLFNTVFSAENDLAPENSVKNIQEDFAKLQNYLLQKERTAITEYIQQRKRVNLILPDKNSNKIEKIPSRYISWIDSTWYQLSPQKKYFLIDTTALSEKNSVASYRAHLTGDLIGNKSAGDRTKLIDTSNLKEIASFKGKHITQVWSPNETSCIIAMAEKGSKERLSLVETSKKGASSQHDQSRSTISGKILRYHLFDIASQSIIKTFENVQSISYIDDNNILITHDNQRTYPIRIERNYPLSSVQKLTSFFVTPSTIRVFEGRGTEIKPSYKASYDLQNGILTVSRRILEQNPHTNIVEYAYENHIFEKTERYGLSPKENYMVIIQTAEGISGNFKEFKKDISGEKILNNEATFLNLANGKTTHIARNVITYQFNPSENMLLFLGELRPSDYIPGIIANHLSSAELIYQVMRIEKDNFLPVGEKNDSLMSAYFTPSGQLVLVNKEGTQKKISLITKPIPDKNNIPDKKQEDMWHAIRNRGLEQLVLVKNNDIPQTIPLTSELISDKDNTLEKQPESMWQAVQNRGWAALKDAAIGVKEFISKRISSEKPTNLQEKIKKEDSDEDYLSFSDTDEDYLSFSDTESDTKEFNAEKPQEKNYQNKKHSISVGGKSDSEKFDTYKQGFFDAPPEENNKSFEREIKDPEIDALDKKYQKYKVRSAKWQAILAQENMKETAKKENNSKILNAPENKKYLKVNFPQQKNNTKNSFPTIEPLQSIITE